MRHEDRPKTIPDAVHAVQFPVYGLTDHPFDLSLLSHGLGISHLGNLVHVELVFTSPRYFTSPLDYRYSAKRQNFCITSIDAAIESSERESIILDVDDHFKSQFFDDKTGVFRVYQFSEEEQRQAGSPLIWEGTLSIANVIFSGKMLHWRSPLQVSTFFLKSEKTILTGRASGPLDKELMQLLEGLQVVNHQEDVLRQYQHEFENPIP